MMLSRFKISKPLAAPSRHRRGRAIGFTLVELLVVIGIIAILIGILLPSLRKARMQAQQLACAANLRSWGQAFQIYAVDYKGILPHSQDESANLFPSAYQYSALSPQNESCYTDTLPPLMHRPRWSDFPQYHKPTNDIWQCPLAMLVDTGIFDYSPEQYGYHSYCMNTYLDTVSPIPDVAGEPMQAYPPFLRLARCRWPSKTLLMFETTLDPLKTDGGNATTAFDCNCGRYPDAASADLGDRHPHQKGKLGGNLMMLDGHIEWTDRLWDPARGQLRPIAANQQWWPY